MKSRWFLLVGACAVAFSFVALCGVSYAQPGRGPGGPGFGDRGFGMLFDEQVRKELEIVPEQEEKLRALGEKMRDEMRELFSGMRDLSREEREAKFAEMREKMQERATAMEAEVNKILMPHQVERMSQIRIQSRMQRMGTSGALGSDELTQKLGITEEQKKRFEELRPEVEKELQDKIRKARDEAQEKLLQVLTPAQQEQLKKMIGEPFEREPFQGFRGRGGPGGRGPGGPAPGGSGAET